MSVIQKITQDIISHPSNTWAKDLGYRPIFTADPKAKIVIIGQAPGRKAQESEIPWNDASGRTLLQWLGISKKDFYNPEKIALVPMDFYFPGTGKTGDLPPRKDFASTWHPPLFDAMPQIQLTLLIGQYAQSYYLSNSPHNTLTDRVRDYQTALKNGFFSLPHPSPRNNIWQKKNPWFAKEVVPHLQQIVKDVLR